ncbi:MAG: hypothetical protein Q7K03_06980 [Dehalococcoidia bacterium]|nr:hypothetical protein [Dehalococcoidia bacterium]
MFARWRLCRKLNKTQYYWVKRRREAKQQGKPARELESLASEAMDEIRECRDDIRRHVTAKLERQAIQLDLPFRGSWEQSESTGLSHMTDESITAIRKIIRQEVKDRRDERLAWLPLIGAVTGLVGVLTGLVGVFAALSANH